MARHTKDNVEQFFDYGLYIPTRTIYMGSIDNAHEDNSGTDWRMAEYIIKALHILDTSNSNPITLKINNPGGDEYQCAAMFDAIENCKSRVIAEVLGYAMSAGCILLQAADERGIAKSARLMVHYGTWFVPEDHPQNVYRAATEGKKFDAWMEKIFYDRMKEKNPKTTMKEVKELCQFDTYLSAKEAVRKGLADYIIEPHAI